MDSSSPLIFTPPDDLPIKPSELTSIVPPLSIHTNTVIFLHGREGYGEDLAQDLFDSKSSDGRSLAEIFPSVKWVFPTAKLRYSARVHYEFLSMRSFSEPFRKSLEGDAFISQWFYMWDTEEPNLIEALIIPGLPESIQDVLNIILEECRSISWEQNYPFQLLHELRHCF